MNTVFDEKSKIFEKIDSIGKYASLIAHFLKLQVFYKNPVKLRRLESLIAFSKLISTKTDSKVYEKKNDKGEITTSTRNIKKNYVDPCNKTVMYKKEKIAKLEAITNKIKKLEETKLKKLEEAKLKIKTVEPLPDNQKNDPTGISIEKDDEFVYIRSVSYISRPKLAQILKPFKLFFAICMGRIIEEFQENGILFDEIENSHCVFTKLIKCISTTYNDKLFLIDLPEEKDILNDEINKFIKHKSNINDMLNTSRNSFKNYISDCFNHYNLKQSEADKFGAMFHNFFVAFVQFIYMDKLYYEKATINFGILCSNLDKLNMIYSCGVDSELLLKQFFIYGKQFENVGLKKKTDPVKDLETIKSKFVSSKLDDSSEFDVDENIEIDMEVSDTF